MKDTSATKQEQEEAAYYSGAYAERQATEPTAEQAPEHTRHTWSGNCLDFRKDQCYAHHQPRGKCPLCLPCPACSKEAVGQTETLSSAARLALNLLETHIAQSGSVYLPKADVETVVAKLRSAVGQPAEPAKPDAEQCLAAETEEEAIAAWNRRPSIDPQSLSAEDICAALNKYKHRKRSDWIIASNAGEFASHRTMQRPLCLIDIDDARLVAAFFLSLAA